MKYDCDNNRLHFASWLENNGYAAIAKSFRVAFYRGTSIDDNVKSKYEEWLAGKLSKGKIFATGPSISTKVNKVLCKK